MMKHISSDGYVFVVTLAAHEDLISAARRGLDRMHVAAAMDETDLQRALEKLINRAHSLLTSTPYTEPQQNPLDDYVTADVFAYIQAIAKEHPSIPLLQTLTAPLPTTDAMAIVAFLTTVAEPKDQEQMHLLLDAIL